MLPAHQRFSAAHRPPLTVAGINRLVVKQDSSAVSARLNSSTWMGFDAQACWASRHTIPRRHHSISPRRLVAHPLQHFTEPLDLFAVLRPIALTLRLECALVVPLRLCREFGDGT